MALNYQIQLDGDTSQFDKKFKEAKLKVEQLTGKEFLIKFDYDGNINQLNKQIDNLYKIIPDLSVDIKYNINEAALKQELENLQKLKINTSFISSEDVNVDYFYKLLDELQDKFDNSFNIDTGKWIDTKTQNEVKSLYEYIVKLSNMDGVFDGWESQKEAVIPLLEIAQSLQNNLKEVQGSLSIVGETSNVQIDNQLAKIKDIQTLLENIKNSKAEALNQMSEVTHTASFDKSTEELKQLSDALDVCLSSLNIIADKINNETAPSLSSLFDINNINEWRNAITNALISIKRQVGTIFDSNNLQQIFEKYDKADSLVSNSGRSPAERSLGLNSKTGNIFSDYSVDRQGINNLSKSIVQQALDDAKEQIDVFLHTHQFSLATMSIPQSYKDENDNLKIIGKDLIANLEDFQMGINKELIKSLDQIQIFNNDLFMSDFGSDVYGTEEINGEKINKLINFEKKLVDVRNETIKSDYQNLQEYYEQYSLLVDEEKADVFNSIVSGLNIDKNLFKETTNEQFLNKLFENATNDTTSSFFNIIAKTFDDLTSNLPLMEKVNTQSKLRNILQSYGDDLSEIVLSSLGISGNELNQFNLQKHTGDIVKKALSQIVKDFDADSFDWSKYTQTMSIEEFLKNNPLSLPADILANFSDANKLSSDLFSTLQKIANLDFSKLENFNLSELKESLATINTSLNSIVNGKGIKTSSKVNFNIDDELKESLSNALDSLVEIKNVLVKVDDNNGFVSITDSIINLNKQLDSTLERLAEMQEKIGQNSFNINIKDDNSMESDQRAARKQDYLMKTYTKLEKKYNEVIAKMKNYGRVESLPQAIISSSNSVFKTYNGNMSDFEDMFSKSTIDNMTSYEDKIVRITKLFELLQVAINENKGDGGFWDDISDINFALNQVERMRAKLREISDIKQSRNTVNTVDDLLARIDSATTKNVKLDDKTLLNTYEQIIKSLTEIVELLKKATSINDELDNQDGSEAVNKEGQSFLGLVEKIDDINAALTTKISLIKEESDLVSSIIPSEITHFNNLLDSLNKISNTLKDIKEYSSNIDLDKIKTVSELETKNNKSTNKSKSQDSSSNDDSEIEKLLKQYDDLNNKFEKLSNKKKLSVDDEKFLIDYENEEYKLRTEIGNKIKNNTKYQDEFNNAVNKQQKILTNSSNIFSEKINSALNNNSNSLSSKFTQLNNLIKQSEKLLSASKTYSEGFSTKLKEAIGNAQNVKEPIEGEEYDATNLNYYIDLLGKLVSEESKLKQSSEGSYTKLIKYQESISQTLAKNTNMSSELRSKFEQLDNTINQMRESGKFTDEEFAKIGQTFLSLSREMYATGQSGKSFFDNLLNRAKQMSTNFLGMYLSLYDIVRYLREAVDVVTELDSALTEMRKVSDESLASLKEYQSETFDIAKEIGTTATELQESTASWMRLGESLKEASESAKDATILLNVSEFDSIDDATESLVAMSQAYTDLSKIEIIDVLNNIGNNYSIATDELATALEESASVLKTQGNDLNEAVALITAGNAVVQDADKVGAGIRTIALRISGTEEAEEELEEAGEDVSDYIVATASKTQKTIMDYTKTASNQAGVDVLDTNGNLRDTYSILQDIADVYAEIQEEDKEYGTNRAQALVEYLAGKNRSNIAASILENPEMLRNVYESSQNSEGSAEKELDKYLDSIEGRLAKFTTAVQKLVYDLIDSDLVKEVVDMGTELVEGADNALSDFAPLLKAIVTVLEPISKILSAILNDVNGLALVGAGVGIFNIKNIKNWYSGLQRVETAMNAISSINTMDEIVESLTGLNLKQAELVLSTKKLDTIEKEQILTKAGLITSNESLSAAQLKNIITSSSLNAEKQKELLTSVGITAENTVEELSEKSLTSAKLNDALATSTLSAIEKEEITSSIASVTANVAQSGAFKALGASILSTTEALLTFLATNPIGWIIDIVGGITLAVVAYDHFTKSEEEIAEAAEVAKNNIDELQSSIESTKTSVDSIAKNYAELAQGVENLGKANQSQGTLNNDEYAEFLELGNQLAELFPQLTHNFDENGNAILDLSGDVDSIVGELNSLVEVQQKLTNQEIIENMPDIWLDYATQLDKLNKKAEYYQEIVNGIANQSTVTKTTYLDDALKQIGVNPDNLTVRGDETALSMLNDEQLGKLSRIISNQLQTVQSEITSNTSSMGTYIHTWLTTDWNYSQMSSDLQSAMSEILLNDDWLSGFDGDKGNWNEVKQWLEDGLLSAVNGIDSEEVQSQISDVIINGSSISGIQGLIDELTKTYGFDVTNPLILYLQTQLEDTQGTVDNIMASLQSNSGIMSIPEMYDEVYAYLSKLPSDVLANVQNNMPLFINTMIENGFDAKSAVQYIVDSLNDAAKADAESVSLKDLFAKDYTDDNTYKEALDDAESSIESLQGYLDKFTDGSYTQGDLNELATEYGIVADSEDEYTVAIKEAMNAQQTEIDNIIDAAEEAYPELTDALETVRQGYHNLNEEAQSGNAFNLSGDAFTDTQRMKDDLDQLGDIYDDITDGGSFDWSSILNNTEFNSVFGNYKEEVDALKKSIQDNAPIEEQQQALSNLLTAYINGTGVLSELTAADAEYVEELLKQYGAIGDLSAVTKAAEVTTEDYKDITLEEANALLESSTASDVARAAFAQMYLTKMSLNGVTIQTAADVDNIINLANTAGAGSIALANLLRVKKALAEFDNGHTVTDEYIWAQQYIESLQNGTVDFGFDMSQFISTARTTDSSSSSDSTSDFDWIQVKIENLEDTISQLDDVIDSSYSSSAEKLKATAQELDLLNQKYELEGQAAAKYLELANGVGLSDEYKQLVQNGALDISTVDSDTADLINQYQDYWDAYKEAIEAQEDTETERRDKIVDAYELEKDDLDELHDNGVITEKEYLDRLKELYETYYKNKIGLENQYQDAVIEHLQEYESYLQSVASAASSVIQSQIDALEDARDTQIDALEEQQDALEKQKDSLQDELNALEEAKEDRENQLALEEALYNLRRAESQRTKLVDKCQNVW